MNEFAKEKYYLLSESQLNIFRLEQAFGGTSINNICETIRINGIFDAVLIQRCINMVVECDPTLRTRIKFNNGSPIQYEKEYEKQHFPVLDFTVTNAEGFKRWEESITREVMPIENMPLFYFAIIKLSEHEGGIFVKTHHLISDGWSQVALINRIASTYLKLVSGENVILDTLPSYRSHVEEEVAYRASRAFEKDIRYWRESLKDMPGSVSFRENHSAELSRVGHRMTFSLSETMNHDLMKYCTVNRIAPMLVFYMAVGIFLVRTQDINSFCMGTPVHNRGNIQARNTTGMYVSTLPFVSRIDENMTFSEYTEYLANEWLELLRHQRLSFNEIADVCRAENSDIDRLYDMVINFHSSHALQNMDTRVSFSGQWHYAGYQAEHLCIHINNIADEKRFSISYDFLTQLFSENDIENMHHYLMSILSKVISNPEKPLCSLTFLSDDEREKVLFKFNSTDTFRKNISLAGALEKACTICPTRVAVIYEDRRYTYKTLLQKAKEIAYVIDKKTSPDAVVAVMVKKSFALYAALTAIAYSQRTIVILSEALPKARISDILSDCGAEAVITMGNNEIDNAEKIDIHEIICGEETLPQFEKDNNSLDNSAYIVYTSGSTGKPKGVEIGQQSIINFSEAMRGSYGTGAVISLCNITFDAFMLESISAIINARTIVIPSETDTENPSAVAKLIKGYAVGFFTSTPSRIQAYLRNDDFKRAIARLECILCGGEAFPSSLLNKLKQLTAAKIINQYGPSETTVGVTMADLNESPVISVGKPMENCRLYILDKNMMPLPIGVYGELYIGGACVAKGYKNAPELTQKVFMDNPFESGERLYRSGDIAAWTQDGEIVLRGRNDSQIKLRGQRIETEEVSLTLMNHHSIRKAVVVLVKDDETEYLGAYYEADNEIDEGELFDFASSYLPGYMIPSAFKYVERIPLTPNGKTDFARLPRFENLLSAQSESCDDETAQRLVEIFREVLHRPNMTVADDYFRLGGDSLNALDALSKIEDNFGIRLRIADIYAARNALRLSVRLKSSNSGGALKLTKAPALEYYPVTKTQLGIYFETMRSPDRCTYNMPCAFKPKGNIDIDRLENALARLIETEDILRVSFESKDGEICQKLNEGVSLKIEHYKDTAFSKAADEFVRPFNLQKAPLIRVGMFSENGENTIMIDIHHIIGDGTTAPIIISRLNSLYMGEDIEKTEISYLDYAFCMKKYQTNTEGLKSEYWKEIMKNPPSLPDFPADFKRPAKFDYKGSQCVLGFSKTESNKIKEFIKKHDITPSMLFTSAFGIFLSKLGGVEEFFVGVPVSARTESKLSTVLGLFVNTLPLRLKPSEEKTFIQYISETKENIIGLIDNAEVSIDKLMEEAKQYNRLGELYNTIISIRPVAIDNVKFGGYDIEQVDISSNSAKAEFNVEIYEEKDCFNMRMEFASSTYMKTSVQMYERSLKAIVLDICANENKTIEDCMAVSPSDKYRLFDMPNALTVPFVDLPMDKHIDMVSELDGESAAIIFHDEITTFSQLKKYSDNLAAWLIEKGVKAGDNVGLLSKRNAGLLVAMVGVLKTGAAYVPMLPSFPENRLKYMMEVSDVKYVLCDDETLVEKSFSKEYTALSIKEGMSSQIPFEDVEDRNGEDTCFVLFTSGSTGQPKGVMLKHQSVSNLFSQFRGEYIEAEGGFLCMANCIFDIFAAETLFTLAVGKTVLLADEDEMLLPWRAVSLIKKYNPGIIEFTPTRAQVFLENREFLEAIHNMPLVFTCGETLPPQLLEKYKRANCKKVINLYGPTEVTIYATSADVTATDKITVGKMFANSRGYVLDKNLRPVMPGAVGEMYFSGVCVSKGYVGRDDLTNERFIPDPFFKGQLMYKSGDLVRLLADGRIDYCGRRDHQIKLNGQRIELGEITKKMLDSELVTQAATVVIKDEGVMYLYGFVVAKNVVDIKGLKEYLKKELPSYMIPGTITQLEVFPRTASGKTDLQSLEKLAEDMRQNRDETVFEPVINEPVVNEPVISEPVKELVALEEKKTDKITVSEIEKIWCEILKKNNIPHNVSFFELGGTSFGVLTLLSEYFARGIQLSLTDLYDNPTIEAQKTFLGLEEDSIELVKQREIVLITGATGFFGAHMLKELLKSGVQGICCIVRGDINRLYDTLKFYFGDDWILENKQKITVYCGDILKDNFGLNEEELNFVREKVRTIVHSAADVRHYASDNTPYIINREGTRNAVELAKTINSDFVYVSTVSLGAEYIIKEPAKIYEYAEGDFDIGQNYMDSIYLKGKFEGERIVRNAMEKGMKAIILRLGRLVGRNSDGIFQKNPEDNAFYGLVKGMSCLDYIADELYNMPMELTAVDECAKAAVLLMKDINNETYHLFNPEFLSVNEILSDIGIRAESTDRLTFERHIRQRSTEGMGAKLALLLSEYQRYMLVPQNSRPVCNITSKKLRQYGFEWSKPNAVILLRKFIN